MIRKPRKVVRACPHGANEDDCAVCLGIDPPERYGYKPGEAGMRGEIAPPSAKHPTCAAVLELLQQATGLLRARLGEEQANNPSEPSPELRALSVGYGFEALRNCSWPFSYADTRDLVQKAFMAGWQSRDFQGKIDGKENQADVAAASRSGPEKVADPDPSAAKRGRFQKCSKG